MDLPEIHIGPYKPPKVPIEVELWAGKKVEIPEGATVWKVHTWPEDWKIRFAISLMVGWWFKRRAITWNLIIQKKTLTFDQLTYIRTLVGADIWEA